MRGPQSSQILSWRRDASQKKSENKAKKKKVAGLEVSSIFTDNLEPESYSFYLCDTFFLVRGTDQSVSSVQQVMLLRRVKEQKMHISALLSVEVETRRFCYALQMPSALE